MNFQEIGEALKQERQRQGLSLDDVFQKTKISPSTLQHIEEGRIEELPHPVYAKGFVKNYAHLLGLDAEEFARLFEQNIAQQEIVGHEPELADTSEVAAPEPKGKSWAVASVLLSVILLGALGWLAYDVFLQPRGTGLQQEAEKPAAAANATGNETGVAGRNSSFSGNGMDASLNDAQGEVAPQEDVEGVELGASGGNRTGAPTGAANETGRRTGIDSQEPQSASAPAGAEVATGPEGAGDVPREEETGTTPAATAAGEGAAPGIADGNETAPVAEGAEHTLEISAVEACWFKANVDNNVRDIFLRPGESVVLHFDNSLEVKLGNAGGVRLTYNGEEFPLDAESGEVATVTLP
jgi:cytoskeleton protein RodZ